MAFGTKLTAVLAGARHVAGEPMHDSAIFQLLDGYKPPDHLAPEDRRLPRPGDQAEQAMVYRAAAMPKPLARTVMVLEQLGFALNRLGRRDEAEAVLSEMIKTHGASSETNGLLGRVYKNRWEAERKADNTRAAKGWLNKAIETYLQGVEADWRDAYPGVNAATLMTLANPADPRLKDLLPVVTYAVKRRLAKGQPDYWDHATLLELAVLASDEGAADAAATAALATVREPWEPRSTANNLRLIHDARAAHGVVLPWADEIVKDLEAKAG